MLVKLARKDGKAKIIPVFPCHALIRQLENNETVRQNNDVQARGILPIATRPFIWHVPFVTGLEQREVPLDAIGIPNANLHMRLLADASARIDSLPLKKGLERSQMVRRPQLSPPSCGAPFCRGGARSPRSRASARDGHPSFQDSVASQFRGVRTPPSLFCIHS